MNAPRVGTQVISRKLLESDRAPPFVLEAQQLIDNGDYQGARAKLEEGIAQPGMRAVAPLLTLAEAYWDDPDTKNRDPKKSIDYLKEAIQLAPKDARPYALLGRYLLSKGLRDQALNFLDRAIELDPSDGAVRRLRDRATLQKKKAYTVVANAADFLGKGAGKAGAPAPKSAAAEHRKEATRLLAIDPKKAAEELAKAEHGVQNEVDQALAALLGASLVSADMSILESETGASRGGSIVRTILAFFVVMVMGVLVGAALFRYAPRPELSQEGPAVLVAQDTPTALTEATQLVADSEEPMDAAWAALAHTLLAVEHGADEGHVQTAEDLLSGAPGPVRRSPPAMLARVLLQRTALADEDDELPADLDAVAGDKEHKDDAWMLMARAAHAGDEGDADRALELLAQAGLADDAPPRALHQLARAYAAVDQPEMSTRLTERLWKAHPTHTPSIVTALAADALKRSEDDEDVDEDGKREPSALEKKVVELLDKTTLPAADVAPAAFMLGAVATTRGDAELAGTMLQRAQENEVPAKYPGLLSRLTQLMLMDLGDYNKAETLLSDGLRTFPGEMQLLIDRTRARVGGGLDKRSVRKLRTDARRRLEDGAIVLPLGRFTFDFSQPYIPLKPSFDTRYFPEDKIQTALDLPDITPAAAERRLGVVTNLQLAQLALGQGDEKQAEEHVRAARKEAPTDPEVHLAEALVRSREGDSIRARDAIEQALEIAPDDPRILLAAARMQLDTGDARAARASLKRLTEEGFVSPAAIALEARVALEEERFEDARTAIAAGQKLAPLDPALVATAIAVEHEEHQLEAGRALAADLRKESPEDARKLAERDIVAGAYLAWAAAEQGSVDEAIEQLRDIVAQRAGFAEAHYMLGAVLAADGKDDEAEVSFDEAVKLARGGPVAELAERARDGDSVEDPEEEEPRKKPQRKRRRRGRRRR